MRRGSADNDVASAPAPDVEQITSPPTRINGLLNSLVAGATVTWWWLERATEPDAPAWRQR